MIIMITVSTSVYPKHVLNFHSNPWNLYY